MNIGIILQDATDSSSSAFSILSERAFTLRITGKLQRVLSTSVIKFRASERDERHCCLVRAMPAKFAVPGGEFFCEMFTDRPLSSLVG